MVFAPHCRYQQQLMLTIDGHWVDRRLLGCVRTASGGFVALWQSLENIDWVGGVHRRAQGELNDGRNGVDRHQSAWRLCNILPHRGAPTGRKPGFDASEPYPRPTGWYQAVWLPIGIIPIQDMVDLDIRNKGLLQ